MKMLGSGYNPLVKGFKSAREHLQATNKKTVSSSLEALRRQVAQEEREVAVAAAASGNTHTRSPAEILTSKAELKQKKLRRKFIQRMQSKTLTTAVMWAAEQKMLNADGRPISSFLINDFKGCKRLADWCALLAFFPQGGVSSRLLAHFRSFLDRCERMQNA